MSASSGDQLQPPLVLSWSSSYEDDQSPTLPVQPSPGSGQCEAVLLAGLQQPPSKHLQHPLLDRQPGNSSGGLGQNPGRVQGLLAFAE